MRWGRSAYETDSGLRAEADSLRKLGVELQFSTDSEPQMKGVEILVVTSGVRVDEELLHRSDSLRLVVTTTSGTDHLDVEAARRRGVTLARCPMARRDAVVDTSLAMGLALLRRLPSLQRRAESGHWARGNLPQLGPQRIRGRKVGIVGAGVIGSAAIQSWRGLGAEVRFSDPRISGGRPIDELCAWAEVLSLHCSLGPESRQLIDAERLELLAPGAIVINTARGDCVDLAALFQASHLGGIGLDVFAQEPPLELGEWANREQVILTPHAAGFHPEMSAEVCREVRSTVDAFLRGRTLPAPV
ncbi:MAG: 2-hydroxyacid dehydrogenase [Myxococcota bacterium]|nr:2-hydroxyacid dehydrogenase [Myxococcota bacterium]